jgi:hypothetical protein
MSSEGWWYFSITHWERLSIESETTTTTKKRNLELRNVLALETCSENKNVPKILILVSILVVVQSMYLEPRIKNQGADSFLRMQSIYRIVM